MSTRALYWALEQAEIKPAPWRVLVLLCDAANSETGAAWLGTSTITRRSGLARSTVIKALQDLHSAGYLVPGDKRYVAHIPKDSRPNVWVPNVHRGTPGDLRGLQLPLDEDSDQGGGGGPKSGPRPTIGRGGGPIHAAEGVRFPDPNQELEPTSEQVPAQGDVDARVSDLGQTLAGAVPPEQAIDRIAACRAAIRKETPNAGE